VLNLHGIHKAYGDHVLIRDFSTILQAGERVGIIGPNGAGKTTLLRIILGEEAPDSGRVEVGKNTASPTSISAATTWTRSRASTRPRRTRTG
jgi:ABC transport system ATP-binding/permease protein